MKKLMNMLLALAVFLGVMAPMTVSAEEAKAEISFMIPDWGAPTEEMLQEFEEQSGIKVNLIPTGWDDIRDKISVAAATKTVAADVFEVDWSWVGEFQAAGWLAPIALEDSKAFPTIDTFMIDGEIYAVPYANDFRIAYFNHDMFGQVGVESAPETWTQVIEGAEKVKAEDVVKYPISIPMGAEENSTTTFLWLTYTRNGIVFNDDNTLNEEATADTMKLIEELVQKELVDPANKTESGMDAYGRIATGEAAYMIGPSSFVSRVTDAEASQVVGQVDPVLLPGKDGLAEATVPFNEAVGISPYSKNPEAALEFVKWYTSAETQERLFEEIDVSPTRIDVLKKLIDEGKLENTGAMLDLFEMVESPFPNGVPEYYTQMSTEIFNTVNQLANGDLTADEATQQVVERVNAIVAENQ